MNTAMNNAMKNTMNTEKLLHLLTEEAQAFNAMAALELRLQECLISKNFLMSESILADMQQISDEIVELDAQRELEFQTLKGQAGLRDLDGIKDLLTLLSPEERDLFAQTYRAIKVGVMKVKAASQGIDAYTRHHISVLKGMVDEFYPDRKQRTYTSKGRHQETLSPMVLDRTL